MKRDQFGIILSQTANLMLSAAITMLALCVIFGIPGCLSEHTDPMPKHRVNPYIKKGH